MILAPAIADYPKERALMQNLFEQFVTLWVVVDPIGTIPVFVAVTAASTGADRKVIAIKAAIVASCVLLFFLLMGQFLLEALGISLEAFQIAGGLVLFLFALSMIFTDANLVPVKTGDIDDSDMNRHSPAIFPLAVPSLASPGAMLAIVMLTDNHRFSVVDQAMTAGIMLVVMLSALVCMLLASQILKLIGTGGAAIVSRVMGMILAAVAVEAIINAVTILVSA
ncbi:MarC family protein [Maritalea sp.]|uniref:MarC family protein n=1 Tax=Maritalea sp. TaxID=2003361 RepID=UPI0039E632FB